MFGWNKRVVRALLAAIVVVAGFGLGVVRAADPVLLSGRVYNGATGVGYGDVAISLCGAGSAVTGANGNWQASVPAGTAYCARVAGGAPALAGPAVRNNPEVGPASSYEYQQAGVNCYRNTSCDANAQKWDRISDDGLDFVYTPGAPAPVAPVATPAATPTSTPTPAAEVTFTAEVGPDSPPVVKLQWSAVGATYRLERSLDRTEWTILTDKTPDATYDDHEVAPDVHYYYRLTPTGADGVAGEPLLADVAVGKVLGAAANADATYVSSDGVAAVLVPAGTVPDEAKCSVNKADGPLNVGDRPLIAGPYELTCHDPAGGLITDFKHDVTWRLTLGKKMQGAEPPQLIRSEAGDRAEAAASSYDKRQKLVSATLPGDGRVAVVATPIDYAWVNYVIIGLLVLGALIGLVFIPIRHRRKLSYQEYLRAKYYNL